MSVPSDETSLVGQNSHVLPIDAFVSRYMQRKQVSGVVVAIIHHNGPAEFHCYGVTDAKNRYPITPDTLFALGSLSKGTTAEVITLLVNEGRLHWDDTLLTLLPPGTPLSDDAKKITLLQLVTHTSGLPRQPMNLLSLEHLLVYLSDGENFYHELDNERVLSYLSTFNAPLSHEPEYSNLGYAILGYILTYQTGESVAALASRMIFQPLAMRNSSYLPQTLREYPRRALGHAGDQPKFKPRGALTPDWQFSNNMVGAANLYSDARDLIEYARAHFSPTHHDALDKAFADVSVDYYPREKEAANIAWVTDTLAGQRITYQVGYIGGYSSYIGFDKANQNAVVVLQNSFNWSNYIGHAILQNRLSAPSVSHPLSGEQVNRCSGYDSVYQRPPLSERSSHL
ncbi:serine hydrolase domain-containing protein [Raoultella planticola]|uniref:serine hydrolase domain-containing protein n=1 Tax=Raoultella planticola TaxID=575 RepID=UPI0013D412E4|nr:serine hydrolase domain-containing protein [Raoultella planticola]EJR0220237.1 serine hydrolase [Raoultella planticola]EJR0350259.1 serine hydrolase [Raoultella planticola]MDM9676886.1 serine hydrolase domain-containing protein [Raoultella planticola]MDV1447901.1 serine hydrolase domain-containing protein [Raoultella planticola]MDV1562475.1 serine hydrolase domain-containing protein [Raoultella planticola]